MNNKTNNTELVQYSSPKPPPEFAKSSRVTRSPTKSDTSPGPPRLPLTSLTQLIVQRTECETTSQSKATQKRSDSTSTWKKFSENLPKPIQVKIEPDSPTNEEGNITPNPTTPEKITRTDTILDRITEDIVEMDTMNQKNIDAINSRILNYIPEFSGADSENPSVDLNRFIDRAEWVRNLIADEDKEIFDQLVQFRLAKDAYSQIRTKNITDFNSLKQTLQDIYSVTESLDELERKWLTCQQKHNETLRQYGQRLLSLLEDFKSGFEAKYRAKHSPEEATHLNDQTAKIFKKGIRNPRLRKEVITIRATGVNTLIKETETIENMLMELTECDIDPPYKNNSRISIRCNQCGKNGHTTETCFAKKANQDRLSKESDDPLPQSFRHYRNPNEQNKYCTYCKRSNHNTQECRSKDKVSNANTDNTQFTKAIARDPPRFVRTYTKSCSFCKINGHDDNECRKRQSGKNDNSNDRYKQANLMQASPRKYESYPRFNEQYARNKNSGYNPRFTNHQSPQNNRPPRDNYEQPSTSRYQPRFDQNKYRAPTPTNNLEVEFGNMKIHRVEQQDGEQDYNNDRNVSHNCKEMSEN